MAKPQVCNGRHHGHLSLDLELTLDSKAPTRVVPPFTLLFTGGCRGAGGCRHTNGTKQIGNRILSLSVCVSLIVLPHIISGYKDSGNQWEN